MAGETRTRFDSTNKPLSRGRQPSSRGSPLYLSPAECGNGSKQVSSSPSAVGTSSSGNNSHSQSSSTCQVGSASRPFNICRVSDGGCSVKLNRSLLELNRAQRKEREATKCNNSPIYLRSGMILLKNYISPHDQVNIINICSRLGVGTGGFYRPGYEDGAKLNLQMMCLGKNWNPDLGAYEDRRSFDCAAPPDIPEELKSMVGKSIVDSHSFLRNVRKVLCPEEELPQMSPDICIVNFYSKEGKLGLHRDKDESQDSLAKGLPVVSFSLGDTAVFHYGDKRDMDGSEIIELESGDVLLFGGISRHIFHGVSSIKENTAPCWLVDETNLRPGRLNLTFRQY